MPETTIQETAIRHVKNVVYNPKCGPLRLYGWCKRRAVINCDLAHVHRPAGIDVACVHIKREDEMLLGVAAVRCDHCVKKKPARGKIDNGCAGNTEGINIAVACEIFFRHRIAHVALPDDRTVHSIECIHVIGFGYRDDRRPAARPVVNVKRLRINIADDCAVKVQVAHKIGRSGRRECGINVKAVARIVIVKLRNVHLRVRRGNCTEYSNARSGNDRRGN